MLTSMGAQTSFFLNLPGKNKSVKDSTHTMFNSSTQGHVQLSYCFPTCIVPLCPCLASEGDNTRYPLSACQRTVWPGNCSVKLESLAQTSCYVKSWNFSVYVFCGRLHYLSPKRLPGTGRMLHSKPMGSLPEYVPPKLKSSETKNWLWRSLHFRLSIYKYNNYKQAS